ncbi:MAG: hypothetical protein H0W87_09425 [Actinobacteria bacterium]|nr:hypothetical protein [Actinomycetota bacterium]
MRIAIILLAVLLTAGTQSQTVSISPSAGDLNTTFVFTGNGWQRGKRVTASYFLRASQSRRAYKTYVFTPRPDGGFVFRLARPIGLVDSGVTSRMCFRQRRVRTCKDFYVAPSAAQFMPATGRPGDLFLLVVSRFLAGHRLQATLTLPSATTRTFVLTARRTDGFVAGGPFGPILVPRGGDAVRFSTKETDPAGAYTVLVIDPKAGSRARAVLVLESGVG